MPTFPVSVPAPILSGCHTVVKKPYAPSWRLECMHSYQKRSENKWMCDLYTFYFNLPQIEGSSVTLYLVACCSQSFGIRPDMLCVCAPSPHEATLTSLSRTCVCARPCGWASLADPGRTDWFDNSCFSSARSLPGYDLPAFLFLTLLHLNLE